MYTLFASDSSALRSAASILMTSFDPQVELLFASNIGEIQSYLALGCVKSVVIDPGLAGYGRDFDIGQLAREFPDVRFSAFSPMPARQSVFEIFETALSQSRPVAGAGEYLGRAEEQPATRAVPLTARQHDVLHLLREGRSTKEIARRLGLAVPTVKTHLAALYRQLGARNRVEAVMKAVAPAAQRMQAHPHAAILDRRHALRGALQTA